MEVDDEQDRAVVEQQESKLPSESSPKAWRSLIPKQHNSGEQTFANTFPLKKLTQWKIRHSPSCRWESRCDVWSRSCRAFETQAEREIVTEKEQLRSDALLQTRDEAQQKNCDGIQKTLADDEKVLKTGQQVTQELCCSNNSFQVVVESRLKHSRPSFNECWRVGQQGGTTSRSLGVSLHRRDNKLRRLLLAAPKNKVVICALQEE